MSYNLVVVDDDEVIFLLHNKIFQKVAFRIHRKPLIRHIKR
jgi:hypothetical protein